MKLTVRCPMQETERSVLAPIKGCDLVFDVETDDCDDMVDCPRCGLFFDPSHPNNQPQPPGTACAWKERS